MTAAEKAKSVGFKSLVELSELSGWPTSTLNNFYKKDMNRFNVVLAGAATKKVWGK